MIIGISCVTSVYTIHIKYKHIFWKKDIHKYTWKSKWNRSILDCIIVNEKLGFLFKYIPVYRGSDTGSDHYFIVPNVLIIARWKRIWQRIHFEPQERYKIYIFCRMGPIQGLYQHRIAHKTTLGIYKLRST